MTTTATAATSAALVDHTYTPDGSDELAPVLSLLDKREGKGEPSPPPRYLLAGANEGDHIEIPENLHAVLVQVVRAMSAGKAVMVSPVAMKLTTQQAADMLGVSRPTVVKFIDDGKIPADRIGTRRSLLLRDVLAYQQQRRQAQYDFLASTAVDLDDETEPQEVLAQLKTVRKAVVAARRTR